jgi:hypothetical protein
MPFEGLLWVTGGQMFQVVIESPMSPQSVRSQSSQAAMAEELRQTKDLIQQLLQRNYAMEYTMMHVIISTLVVY